jgi:short-subunit dehydrogenase
VNALVLSLRDELKAEHPRVKVGLVCPGPIATPWWDDAARGFRAADAPPPPARMLSAEAVAGACLSLLEQDASCNQERVVMDPA